MKTKPTTWTLSPLLLGFIHTTTDTHMHTCAHTHTNTQPVQPHMCAQGTHTVESEMPLCDTEADFPQEALCH